MPGEGWLGRESRPVWVTVWDEAEGTGSLDLLVFSEGSQVGKLTPSLCTWQNSTEVSCLPEASNNHTAVELGGSVG